jgi:hypothetical protein
MVLCAVKSYTRFWWWCLQCFSGALHLVQFVHWIILGGHLVLYRALGKLPYVIFGAFFPCNFDLYICVFLQKTQRIIHKKFSDPLGFYSTGKPMLWC